MEQTPVRALVAAFAIVVLVAGSVMAWRWLRDNPAAPAQSRIPGEERPFQIEVLNGSGIDGLAAATTSRLRAAGLDVVFYGTAADDSMTVTRLIVRRGDSTAARAVLEVLGMGIIVDEPDARRVVDVTVLLGRDAAVLDLRP